MNHKTTYLKKIMLYALFYKILLLNLDTFDAEIEIW
jgi:hypothetical protein